MIRLPRLQLRLHKVVELRVNQQLVRTENCLLMSSFKQSTYVGVPVVVSLKLYIAVSVANLNLEQFDIPNAKIQQQGKSIQYQDTQGNTNYQVIEQKFWLRQLLQGI